MIPFKGLTAYNASHSPFGWSNKDAPMVFVHTRTYKRCDKENAFNI